MTSRWAMGTRVRWNNEDDWRQHGFPEVTRHPRPYVLRNPLFCGCCSRRMEVSWNHGLRTIAANSTRGAGNPSTDHPKTIYVREDRIVQPLDGWLAHVFGPNQVDRTVDVLYEAADDPALPHVDRRPGTPCATATNVVAQPRAGSIRPSSADGCGAPT
jgi:hypothetical protein